MQPHEDSRAVTQNMNEINHVMSFQRKKEQWVGCRFNQIISELGSQTPSAAPMQRKGGSQRVGKKGRVFTWFSGKQKYQSDVVKRFLQKDAKR